jgi:sugar transferase (PEP-CTERM system associated)
MIRLFRVSIPASVLWLVLCETLLLFGLFIAGVYLSFSVEAQPYLLYEGGLWRITIVVAIIQIALYLQDLYENIRFQGHLFLIQQLCTAVGAAFLIQAMLGYGRSNLELNKWSMVYGSGLTLVVLPFWRFLFTALMRRAMPAEKVLFLGYSNIVQQIWERVNERPEMGLSLIGYMDDEEEEGCSFPARRLGCFADVKRIAEETRPGRIVVGKTERRGSLPMEQLLELRFAGIHIEEAATMYESVFGRVSTADLRPSQLVFSAELGPRSSNVHLQSVYSMILGITGLVISLPIMALVAILVKLSSPGPILYRQTRVGLRGATFQVFKFRSMYADAEASTGAVWATKSDPRITPIGRWLRKLRLDELPQFFNVIRGEMAVAGPRPERPEFCRIIEEKIPFYKQRHSVKPGITGWAQINQQYADTIEDSITKLEYDLYYIKNLAPSLDAYIIFHTLKVMLLSRGAR